MAGLEQVSQGQPSPDGVAANGMVSPPEVEEQQSPASAVDSDSGGLSFPSSSPAPPQDQQEAPAVPPGFEDTLLGLSLLSPRPLGGGAWDIDFVLFHITPSTLPVFSKLWTVGGSSVRGHKSPFPQGLEICNQAPFTLRVVLEGNAPDGAYAHWGLQLISCLWEAGLTCQPTLVPPNSLASAAKALAREPRCCSARVLARALQHPTLGHYRLYLCKYGLKVPALDFFNECIAPALDCMNAELGEEEALRRYSSWEMDWATQSPLRGAIVLVKPPFARNLPWVAGAHGVGGYPMFGRWGGGFGGVTLTADSRRNLLGMQFVKKANVYPGGFVHTMKGMGLPPTSIPPGQSTRWLLGMRAKLESVLAGLADRDPRYLTGCRVEFRTHGFLTTWPALEAWLEGLLAEVMPCLTFLELPVATALRGVEGALNSAKNAGLFAMGHEVAGEPMARWRKHDFYRLLQCMGLVHKTTYRTALLADMANKPWGPPDGVVVPRQADLPRDPSMPLGLIIVPIPHGMVAARVQRLGFDKADLIDWPLLASHLQRPDLAATFEEVARLTKWRRHPRGRGPGGMPHFTATPSVGKGTLGPLGTHLALAVVNLVSAGQHMSVQKLPGL